MNFEKFKFDLMTLLTKGKGKDIVGFALVIFGVLLLFTVIFAVLFNKAAHAEGLPRPFNNAYVSLGMAKEFGNTFGNGGEIVGVGRIGTELWEGWKLEYEHHSNAHDENDKNSYDAIGIIMEFKFK